MSKVKNLPRWKRFLIWFKPISGHSILNGGAIVYYKELFGYTYEAFNTFDEEIIIEL